MPIEMKVFSYFQGREERYGKFFIWLKFNSLFSDDRHLLMFCHSMTLPHPSPTHRKIVATSLHRSHHASSLKRIFLKFFSQKACWQGTKTNLKLFPDNLSRNSCKRKRKLLRKLTIEKNKLLTTKMPRKTEHKHWSTGLHLGTKKMANHER